MKLIATISWFLGGSMFMFGVLKFLNPFKQWYSVQISNSGLGNLAYAMGIMGEIAVGLVLILAMVLRARMPQMRFATLVIGASAVIIIMMSTGIYVHFHPNVPAEVLPLKIKPPYIPGMFMLLALVNIFLVIRMKRSLSGTF